MGVKGVGVKVFGAHRPQEFRRRCVCISRHGRHLRGVRRGTGLSLNVIRGRRPAARREVHNGVIRRAARLGHEGRGKISLAAGHLVLVLTIVTLVLVTVLE